MRGKYIGIRFVTSTIIAAFLDSLLFISIAYYGTFSHKHLFSMIINVWLIKIAIEVIFLPISIRITKWIKQKEGIDIYDYQTNFSVFSLDTWYTVENNRFNNGNI